MCQSKSDPSRPKILVTRRTQKDSRPTFWCQISWDNPWRTCVHASMDQSQFQSTMGRPRIWLLPACPSDAQINQRTGIWEIWRPGQHLELLVVGHFWAAFAVWQLSLSCFGGNYHRGVPLPWGDVLGLQQCLCGPLQLQLFESNSVVHNCISIPKNQQASLVLSKVVSKLVQLLAVKSSYFETHSTLWSLFIAHRWTGEVKGEICLIISPGLCFHRCHFWCRPSSVGPCLVHSASLRPLCCISGPHFRHRWCGGCMSSGVIARSEGFSAAHCMVMRQSMLFTSGMMEWFIVPLLFRVPLFSSSLTVVFPPSCVFTFLSLACTFPDVSLYIVFVLPHVFVSLHCVHPCSPAMGSVFPSASAPVSPSVFLWSVSFLLFHEFSFDLYFEIVQHFVEALFRCYLLLSLLFVSFTS